MGSAGRLRLTLPLRVAENGSWADAAASASAFIMSMKNFLLSFSSLNGFYWWWVGSDIRANRNSNKVKL